MPAHCRHHSVDASDEMQLFPEIDEFFFDDFEMIPFLMKRVNSTFDAVLLTNFILRITLFQFFIIHFAVSQP